MRKRSDVPATTAVPYERQADGARGHQREIIADTRAVSQRYALAPTLR